MKFGEKVETIFLPESIDNGRIPAGSLFPLFLSRDTFLVTG